MFGMKFKSWPSVEESKWTTIDVAAAWMATNTDQEVDIIKLGKGQFELWIGADSQGIFSSFDAAKREAETKVAFKVNLGKVVA